MNLFEYVGKRKDEIEMYLDVALREKAESTNKDYAHLYESLREFSIKGKHLRGCFFLLSYEMAGGKNLEAVIPVAAAIEINGSALLIHDDIMDKDMLRRGGMSMFAKYIEEGKKIKAFDPHDYGVGSGILIGDIGIILGFELLDRAGIEKDFRQKVFTQYAQDMQITAVGQMMDYDFSSTSREPNEEEILEMYRMKTARYSLINPFLMGAQATGANEEYCATLLKIAENLGILFQIRDDVMGLMGDEKETGKAARSDVRENKKTLIRKYLFESAEGDNAELLKKTFGSDQISDDDFAELVNFVKTSGVEERINQKLQSMAAEIRKEVKQLSIEQSFKDLMEELIQYSLTRTK